MANTATHWGKKLQKEIDDKGYQKKFIAKHLQMDEKTLNKRLEDGEFTIVHVEILQAKRYLPND